MILALASLWELGGITIFLQFQTQLFSSSRDRHTSAVKAEREKDIKPTQSFIPSVKIAFRHGEGVAQMEQAIHVSIRECNEEFWLFRRLYREILVSIPNVPSSAL